MQVGGGGSRAQENMGKAYCFETMFSDKSKDEHGLLRDPDETFRRAETIHPTLCHLAMQRISI